MSVEETHERYNEWADNEHAARLRAERLVDELRERVRELEVEVQQYDADRETWACVATAAIEMHENMGREAERERCAGIVKEERDMYKPKLQLSADLYRYLDDLVRAIEHPDA